MDKLYEYTQGVPRRINAWCDLALVAGFAEGRHEIDGEFIDLVIAAQGGSLEGAEDKESCLSEDLVALADTSAQGYAGLSGRPGGDGGRVVGSVDPVGGIDAGND